MKKKVLLCFIISLLGVGMAACSYSNDNNMEREVTSGEDVNETKEASSGDEASKEKADDSNEDGNQTEDNEEENGTVKSFDKALYDDILTRDVVFLNNDDAVVESYSLTEKLGLSKDAYIEVRGIRDSLIIYTTSEDGQSVLYEYDVINNDKKEVTRIDGYFAVADIYEDKLYVEYNKSGVFGGNVYDVNTLEELECDSSFYDAVNGYSVDLARDGHNFNKCTKRIMDEDAGRVIIDKFDDGITYYLYDNGEIKDLKGLGKVSSVLSYDDKYIVYSRVNEEDWSSSLWIYSFESDSIKELTSTFSEYKLMENGKVYWLEEDDSEYGRSEYSCKVYDTESMDIVNAYSFKKNPGMEDAPGSSGFTVIDGNIYFIADEDQVMDWYEAKASGDSYQVSALNVYDERKAFWDLGKVEYLSETTVCDKCGKVTNKYYEEYFVLDEMYENAASINSILCRTLDEDVEEEDCDIHPDPNMICSNDIVLEDVEIIGSNYLKVKYSGYWYGGGAHGMPTLDNYLFNLSTGEPMGFKDVYTGSLDDLAEMLADKAVDMMDLPASENPGFYSDDPDEVRGTVLETVTQEMFSVEFKEESVEFIFEPYVLGPYASGYIIIEVSYDELGIDEFSLS